VYRLDSEGATHFGVTKNETLQAIDERASVCDNNLTHDVAIRAQDAMVEAHRAAHPDRACSALSPGFFSHWDLMPPVPRTPVPEVFPRARANLMVCAWASGDGAREFERLFFTHPDPAGVLAGETALDILETAFVEMCCRPRNHLSHGCVYNRSRRLVAVKTETPPYFAEEPLGKFAERTVPWLAECVAGVCRKILGGGLVEDLEPRAREVMRALYADAGAGATFHALRVKPKSGPGLKLARRLGELLKDEANAARSTVSTFEKLRRLYPADHEHAPKYEWFKKRAGSIARTAEPPILDEKLLKICIAKARYGSGKTAVIAELPS
jgi:hypothetical protein